MQFCHPLGVRLALLSGHATFVGKEWQELDPIFHQAALEKGCHCDQQVIGERPQHRPSTGANATKQLDEPAAIRTAIIKMLERKDTPDGEGDFTAADNPNTNVVASLCGFKPSKDQVLEVWHALQKEVANPTDAPAE